MTRARVEAAFARTEGEKMMLRYIAAIDAGKIPEGEVLTFLREAFSRILAGEPPQKALTLERPQGNVKHHAGWWEALRMVARMDLLGETYEQARDYIADTTGKSDKTIARYYSRHKDSARDIYRVMKLCWQETHSKGTK